MQIHKKVKKKKNRTCWQVPTTKVSTTAIRKARKKAGRKVEQKVEQKGREEGRAEGREEGRNYALLETARKMQASGAAPSFIKEMTGIEL